MLNETLGRRRVVLFSCLVSAALLFGASPVVLAASPDPPGRREGARGLWTALDGPESAVGAGETVARRYRLDLDASTFCSRARAAKARGRPDGFASPSPTPPAPSSPSWWTSRR
jgi:hypothetical protein